MAGMHITGEISFPLLSDEAIEFEGFKVDEAAETKTSNKSWAAYNTALVKYGESWKE
jgi:hypothetical protein